MQFRFHAAVVVMLAAAVLPVSLSAQFQAPTSEELKMTEEPKAPGAAAIYLYREETVDDNLHFHSFYERAKILTEKGKELATVGVPYPGGKFQITDVKARTIHADGTVIPLDVKPTDLLMALNTRSGGGRTNKMTFTLPSVEVGSILEYRWQLRYDDQMLSSPEWEIQQPFYVRKAHYSFIPFKYMYRVTDMKGNSSGRLMYSSMLPDNVKINQDASGKYSVDVADVPAFPNEDYMPPVRALMERVEFYYTPYVSKDEFWKHEGDSWSKQMDHFANDKALKEAVSQIVAAGDSEKVKAQKLYDAVAALDNTDFTRRKSKEELKRVGLKEIRTADDVWKQKSGSSDEIALLYLAMLRAAGLKAYAMFVCNQDQRVFNPYFMSMGQLDDVLVIAVIDGKEVPLDPGDRFTPFGQLGWRHTSTAGIRQSDKGSVFVSLPGNAYKDALTLRVADVTIAPDGSLTGMVRVSLSGPEGVRWRHIAIENDEDEVKKEFNEYIRALVPDGVNGDFDHFLGLEDYHSPLMGIVKLSGSLGTQTGKRVFLPGVFFESRAKHPFVSEQKRLTAVDMHFAEIEQDQVVYHIPEGYKVESAPPDTSVPLAGKAVFRLKSTVQENRVEVTRSLTRGFTMVPPQDYSTLRDFYQKVTAADQQQLVLLSAGATAMKTTATK